MPSTLDFVKRPRNWGFVLSNGFLGSVPECDLPGGQIVQHHIIVLALSQENAPCRIRVGPQTAAPNLLVIRSGFFYKLMFCCVGS